MVIVIDYGLGNLRSVSNALEILGAKVEISNNRKEILKAKAIVLPGVGAFYRGMENIKRLKILPSILEAIREGKPFLGICLGLQLLFTESEEHKVCRGFGIIKGRVRRLDTNLKCPHMGWNQIKIKNPCLSGRQEKSKIKIFKGIPDNSYFYFVHSYFVEPEDKAVIIGTSEYGKDFVSAINKNNLWGLQFHPEKSGEQGLKILENFLSLC